MKQLFSFFLILLFCPSIKAQDTLFTKSVLGAGSKNLSVTNPVYANGKIVFLTSNPIDSVAAPDMKMVTLDTCGNVEKIITIPLDGHWGVNFGGGFSSSEVLKFTADGNFFITGNQFLPNTENRGQLILMKLDTTAKVLFEWKFKTQIQRFNPSKVLETSDAYYISGTAWGALPIDIDFFLLKVDKKLNYQWHNYPGYSVELRETKDTINIVGFGFLIKLFNNGTKMLGFYSGSIKDQALSRFINDTTIIHFDIALLKDSSNNWIRKLTYIQTNDRMQLKKQKNIPFINSNEVESLESFQYDENNTRILLNTSRYDVFSHRLLLRQFDTEGNLFWSRKDTITHYNVKYTKYKDDFYSGFAFLPSKNIFGLIVGQNIYDFNNYKVSTELRVLKFNPKGENILKNCNKFNSINSLDDIDKELLVSPNPFSNQINFNMVQKEIEEKVSLMFDLILTDIFGRIVFQNKMNDSSITIVRGNLPSGIYFYVIKYATKIVASGKVIAE